MKVITKTASTGPGDDAHPYMYSGHTSGFAVSGSGGSATGINVSGFGYDEGATLTLRRESTYYFRQYDSSNSGYGLQISTDPSGKGHQTYTSGVVSATGHPSGWLKFTVPHGAPDTLYYTSSTYDYVGGPISIVDAPAAPKTGSVPGESIILNNFH